MHGYLELGRGIEMQELGRRVRGKRQSSNSDEGNQVEKEQDECESREELRRSGCSRRVRSELSELVDVASNRRDSYLLLDELTFLVDDERRDHLRFQPAEEGLHERRR